MAQRSRTTAGGRGGTTPPAPQRNALAPSILAAIALFIAPALVGGEWFPIIQYVVAILALIMLWFAVQARHWWWAPVLLAVAVLWNPVFPFPFEGVLWAAAQPATALVLLAAGVFIKAALEQS